MAASGSRNGDPIDGVKTLLARLLSDHIKEIRCANGDRRKQEYLVACWFDNEHNLAELVDMALGISVERQREKMEGLVAR